MTNQSFTAAFASYSMTLILFEPAPLPTNGLSMTVNTGNMQRSMINSLWLVFDQPVALTTSSLMLQNLVPFSVRNGSRS